MPISNEDFIKKAFEAGLTEDQVRSAVAERNQILSSQKPSMKQKALEFSKSDTLPTLGQAAGNIAGVSFGLPGRVIVGAGGRVGGEVLSQAMEQAIDPVNYFPQSKEEAQRTVDRTGSNIQDLASQAAIGTAGELIGDGLGYAGGKAIETVAPIVSQAVEKGSGVASNLLKRVPGLEGITNTVKSVVSDKAERAANTLLELNSSKRLRELAEDRGINLGQEFAKDAEMISGTTRPEIRASVNRVKNEIGSKIKPLLGQMDEKVNIKDYASGVFRKYNKLKKDNPKLANQYLKSAKEWFDTNGVELSPINAWQTKSNFDKILRTSSGKESRSAITQGEAMFKKELADTLRGKIHDIPEAGDLLKKYELFSFYDDALAGTKVADIPDQIMGSVRGTGLIDRVAMGALRDPQNLLNFLKNSTEEEVIAAKTLFPQLATMIDAISGAGSIASSAFLSANQQDSTK